MIAGVGGGAQVAQVDWSAIAAGVSALVAASAIWLEGRRIRLQIGIDNMWRLIDRWESPQFRRCRAVAAAHLLENLPPRGSHVSRELLDVLDQFELLAYLVVGSKTLSLEDAWMNFSGPAIEWWRVCQPIIDDYQQVDPTLYEGYSELARQLLKQEARRVGRRRSSEEPSLDDVRAFLTSEKLLVPDDPPVRRRWSFLFRD